MATDLNPDQATASAIIQQQLAQWGLDSLSGKVSDLIRQGLGSDAITIQLEATPEYKARFAGNTARIANGLAALTPAQYIATENSYRQVLQSYGLPATFYDQPADFQKLIENDLSPDEVKSRASDAQAIWLGSDPTVKSVWRDFYGLSDGAAIASILDPNRATTVVHNMAQTAQAGAAARDNGLVADQDRITKYVDQGMTLSQLQQGFQQVGQALPTDQSIAARFGTTFDQADEEGATISGLASAKRKQAELYDSERQLFAGRASADQTSLNRRPGGNY